MKDLFRWSKKTRLALFVVLVVGLTLGLTGCFGLFGTPPTPIITLKTSNPQPGDDLTFDLSNSEPGGSGDQITNFEFTFELQSPSADAKVIIDGYTKNNYAIESGGWDSVPVDGSEIQTGTYKATLQVKDGETLKAKKPEIVYYEIPD